MSMHSPDEQLFVVPKVLCLQIILYLVFLKTKEQILFKKKKKKYTILAGFPLHRTF